MKAGLREVVNLEDRPTLERWLRLLPEEMIQRNPELLMIRVYALQFSWRLDLQAPLLLCTHPEPHLTAVEQFLAILRFEG